MPDFKIRNVDEGVIQGFRDLAREEGLTQAEFLAALLRYHDNDIRPKLRKGVGKVKTFKVDYVEEGVVSEFKVQAKVCGLQPGEYLRKLVLGNVDCSSAVRVLKDIKSMVEEF